MKLNTLTDTTKPWVVLKFTHFRDNKIHTFRSEVNRLTGDRLSSFDSGPPTVGDSIGWVRSVIKDVFKKSKGVVFYDASKHFKK
jgi:hypothetical protein